MPAVWKFRIVPALASSSRESSCSVASPVHSLAPGDHFGRRCVGDAKERFPFVGGYSGGPRPVVDHLELGGLLAELHPANPRL